MELYERMGKQLNKLILIHNYKLILIKFQTNYNVRTLFFYNNNFNNQMSLFESSAIQTTLEVLMFILIIAASYALVFEETQYWYFIILIMFAFLFYVMRKKYTATKNKAIIHQLPIRKKPTFQQQYQKRQMSRIQLNGDKQNSFISYLNRTKKAGDSFSRLMSKQGDEKLKDFSFIKRDDNKKLMSHSFIAKSKNPNDTFLREIEQNQIRRQEREEKAEQKFKECNKRYYQTLDKLGIRRVNVQNLYVEVKNLCKSFTKQLYQQQLNNLKQIIQSLEELYTIKVICRDIVDLDRKLSDRKLFEEYRMEIKLEEVIQKLIKSKGKELSYPVRKTNQHMYTNLKAKQNFSERVQPTLLLVDESQKSRRKLEKLVTQQIKLNSYFNDENNHWVSARELIQKLKLISEEIENQEYYNYLSEGRNNVPKQYSQKLLLIFNISRNKLNDIVGDKNRALLFSKKSIMGWIRNQRSVFQIKQTLNSDFGHPHYDLCVHKSPDSNFYCEYGANNGYSLIYMYLTSLKSLQKQFVHENKILLDIIPRCC